jgi:Lyase
VTALGERAEALVDDLVQTIAATPKVVTEPVWMPPPVVGVRRPTGNREWRRLNAPHNFGPDIAAEIARLTDKPFISAPNKFEAQGGLDGIVATAATLRGLAVTLMKVANDIRWLASGPRTGIGELKLPANEPGSSIMPARSTPPNVKPW